MIGYCKGQGCEARFVNRQRQSCFFFPFTLPLTLTDTGIVILAKTRNAKTAARNPKRVTRNMQRARK